MRPLFVLCPMLYLLKCSVLFAEPRLKFWAHAHPVARYVAGHLTEGVLGFVALGSCCCNVVTAAALPTANEFQTHVVRLRIDVSRQGNTVFDVDSSNFLLPLTAYRSNH